MRTGLIKQISILEPEKVKTRLKAVDHFKKCPCCGGKDLHSVGPDVICMDCCWDSTAWDVHQGGMDNFYTSAREYGFAALTPHPVHETEFESNLDEKTYEIQGA